VATALVFQTSVSRFIWPFTFKLDSISTCIRFWQFFFVCLALPCLVSTRLSLVFSFAFVVKRFLLSLLKNAVEQTYLKRLSTITYFHLSHLVFWYHKVDWNQLNKFKVVPEKRRLTRRGKLRRKRGYWLFVSLTAKKKRSRRPASESGMRLPLLNKETCKPSLLCAADHNLNVRSKKAVWWLQGQRRKPWSRRRKCSYARTAKWFPDAGTWCQSVSFEKRKLCQPHSQTQAASRKWLNLTSSQVTIDIHRDVTEQHDLIDDSVSASFRNWPTHLCYAKLLLLHRL